MLVPYSEVIPEYDVVDIDIETFDLVTHRPDVVPVVCKDRSRVIDVENLLGLPVEIRPLLLIQFAHGLIKQAVNLGI